MNAPDKGRLELIVREPKEYAVPLELLDRAAAMLYAVLASAGMSGQWQFLSTGLLKSQANRSQYWMDVRQSELSARSVTVVVCASLIIDRELGGVLLPPQAVSVPRVLPLLMATIDQASRARWQGVVAREERQEMRAISRAQIAGRVAEYCSRETRLVARVEVEEKLPSRLWTSGVRFLPGLPDNMTIVSGSFNRSANIRARVEAARRPASRIIHRLDDEPIEGAANGSNLRVAGKPSQNAAVTAVAPQGGVSSAVSANVVPLAAPLDWRPASPAVTTEAPKVQNPSAQLKPKPVVSTNGLTKPSKQVPARGSGQKRLITTDRDQRGWRVTTKFVKPVEKAARQGFTPFKLERFHAFFDQLEGKRKPKK